MASSSARYQRNIVLGLVLAFLVLLIPHIAFADNGIRLTIDYANGATIFIQDDTAGTPPVEITGFTSPYTYASTNLVSGHTYSVWVTRGGFRMLVKNWPNDWTVDSTGTVATGVWAGGTEPVHFSGADVDLSITKQCEPLIAGAQGVLAYTLTITYENGTEPTDTTVVDQLPSGLTNATYTLDSVSQGAWPTTSPYSISLGSVTPGTTHIIRIYADVDFSLTSIAANTATVTSSKPDVMVTDNNSDTCINSISPRGRIVVQKATNPSGDSSTFSFSGDLGTFNLLGDGASQSFIVQPGTYTVSESTLAGWILSSITGDNNGDPDDGVVITVVAGETKTVTFHNTKIGGYVTITPGSATNAVGQEHTFLITAYATGAVPTSWNLVNHSVTPAPDSENLTGPVVASGGMSATWELTINNYDPGTFQASATVEIDFGSATVTASTDGTGGSSGPAEKKYIAARITLDPLEAYNGIGDNHTVTATVEVNDGTSWEAKSGVVVTFSLPTNNAGATFVGGTSDTTDGSGEASATITASAPGLVKIHASADIFGDGTYVVTTGSGGENSADAAKTYIKAKMELTPTPEDDAINKVGQQHTIVATVSVTENGSTWTAVPGASVTLAIASDGTGSASLNPLSGTTNGSGQFSSQLVANDPGIVRVSGSATISSYKGLIIAQSVTVSTGTGSPNSENAKKKYIEARITLDPLEAYNGIGDNHTVTATVEVNDGTSWEAKSGVVVTFSLPTNNAGATFVGGTSDTTDGSGEASATITASAPGLVKIHASADIFGDGTYVVTTGSGGENSADAAKTYIKAKMELTPTPEDDAINKVGQRHTIVATVSVTENGSTWTAVPGASVTLAIASDGTGSASLNPLSGTTNGSGQFSSQLVANDPGIVRVSGSATISSYKGLIIAQSVTVSTGTGSPNSENAKKKYIEARITLDPLEAYNGIGDNHTVTATVEVNDGTSWEAKSGVVVTFSLPTNNAGATFVGGTSDTTDGSGEASATITASAPGLVKIHASADIFGDGTYVVTTGSGGENSADAAKTYIKAKMELTPTPEDDAINKVGQQHTIVATVSVTENGSTWTAVPGASVTLAIASDGTGSASLNPLSGTTNGSGQFSSQLVANDPGIVRVSGSATISSYKGLIIAQSVTVSTGTGSPNSENAKKKYIEARITLDPLEAYNGIGDNHTVTATVEVNDGTSWEAKSGVVVTFSLPTNNAGATFVGGTSDTTDGSGEASATITASAPGLVKIHASADIFGDGTYVVTTGSGGENSADAAKTYIKAKMELTPTPEDDAINKVGQQHTIVATVSVTENGSTWTAVPGASVTLAIASDGTGSASLNPLSGTTNGSGQFSSQLVANDPGIVRVSGSATISSYKGLIIAQSVTVSTGTGSPNSENAKKTYVSPSIDLQKTVYRGHDNGGNSPGYELIHGESGDDITYVFTVKNTGDTYLNDITIADGDLGIPPANPTLLSGSFLVAPNATAVYYYETTITKDLINTASVSGNPTDASGVDLAGIGDVNDHDSAEVDMIQPGINIRKTADPAIIYSGDSVTYTYEVTNNGDDPLSNVTVTDDKLGTISGPDSGDTNHDGKLDPGETWVYTKTANPTEDVTNTGTAKGYDSSGTLREASDTATVDVINPEITVEKSTNSVDADAAPGPSIPVGGAVTWTYVVTNTGDAPLTGIQVTDTDLGSVGTVASLAAGASHTFTKTGAASAGQYENTGFVTAKDALGGDVSDNDLSHYFGTNPAISLEKSGSFLNDGNADGVADSGETVTYTFTVENTGNVTLTSVKVTDPKVTVVGGPIASLAVGAIDSATFTASYTLTQADIDAGKVDNTATVTGTPPSGSDVTDTDNETVTFEPGPAISLEKSGSFLNDGNADGVADSGETVTYTFTVENTGNVTLTSVKVTDPKVTVVGGPIASLAVGAIDSATFTASYTLTQADIDAGKVDNTATVTGTPPSGSDVTDTDNETVTFEPGPAISLEKSTNGQDADAAPGPSLAVGNPITWAYVVTNTGNVILTNIIVTDSDLGAVGTIASLAPGAAQTLTMSGTAVVGQYENTGTATVTYGGTDYTDSDDSHYFGAGADLSLEKSVDNAEPREGDTIVYTITLANGGPSVATGVQITDALPAGLTYVSDNGGGAYDNGTGVWSVATLANGSSTSLAITATVDAGTAGSTITNTAEVTVAGQPDPDSTPNNHDPDEDDQSSVDLTVQSADLVVVKTVDNPTPSEGETIVYTITLTNDGPSDASGITLTDSLPVGVTYVSDDSGGAYDPFTGVWTVGGLANGEIATLNITATVDAGTAGTTITNAAEVTTSDQPDPDPSNNRDTADITVTEGGGGGGSTGEPCEGRVIINEVAWSGTTASSQDEWIELRNLGTIPVDLTDWTLRWRRKNPTTEEEKRWKTVDLSGMVLPAEFSACDLAQEPQTASVTLVKTDFDAVSWQVVTEQDRKKDESFYTLERRHDETISNAEADLVYDESKPYRLELDDLGDVIQLLNADGEIVDTANAFEYPNDGWPAGDAQMYATMERTDPLGPDVADNWHTNLGIITWGEDSEQNPLIATADAPNSDVLDQLSLDPDVPPAKTRAGARLEVGLEVTQEERRAYGWPWVRVTQPELVASAGGGGAVEQGAGFTFSGRYTNGVYWLGIDTAKLLPGRYNVWVVYGGGKTVLVPIEVLP